MKKQGTTGLPAEEGAVETTTQFGEEEIFLAGHLWMLSLSWTIAVQKLLL